MSSSLYHGFHYLTDRHTRNGSSQSAGSPVPVSLRRQRRRQRLTRAMPWDCRGGWLSSLAVPFRNDHGP